MKKVPALLIVALIVGVLVSSLVPATSQEPIERTTITLFDPNKTDYEKHVRGTGDPFRPGDWHVYVDRLLDPETCEVAGKVVGEFIFVKRIGKFNGWLTNSSTVRLPDGKITVYGAAKFSDFAKDAAIFSVTGGTGAYRDVSGELSFDPQPVKLCGTKGSLSTLDLGPSA